MTTKELVEWLDLKLVGWALVVYAVLLGSYWIFVG
jgi:hypothetical protein